MISRVAEHCFWFGRYLDRAESSARLLETTQAMVFDAGLPVTDCWEPLIIVSGESARFKQRFGEDRTGDGETVQRYLTWDTENMVSLVRSVGAARENARVIRDTLSEEVWEEINQLYHWLTRPPAHEAFDTDRESFYRHVRNATQLCMGLVRSTMLHDQPMNFLWLGIMLERVGQLARILDMHHHTMERERERHRSQGPEEIVSEALWLALLRACSGFDAFMRRYQGRVSVAAVVEFLVFEDRFPRSLMYGLRSAHRLVGEIWPDGPPRHEGASSRQRLQALVTWLDAQRRDLERIRIHDLLTRVVDESALACEALQAEAMHPEG